MKGESKTASRRVLSFGVLGLCSGGVKEKWHKWLPYAFMLLAALSRWPGLFPQNFSVFYGLAFCAGAFFPGLMAWWLPLGTMLATDVLLNALYYHQPILNGYMLVKILSFAGLVGLGRFF